ncbi:hypothetical protein LEN26_010397 [Aphanomyces euteiches]|nr:hypothetical protein AeMF1_009985 [Aphanomyces euteiches]KAH9122062.1 hypothetical protein LEN26_010397 [Aphanomyces euteiches]KAH9196623.1 hypothetical protein AeNC1_001387 [Aphanomyces euteiches]
MVGPAGSLAFIPALDLSLWRRATCLHVHFQIYKLNHMTQTVADDTQQSPMAKGSPQELSMATPPFLASLYDILNKEDPAVIGWCDDGKAFGVYNVEVLEATILPSYYRHGKFASFQRQLNYFGFRKVLKPRATEPSTFYAQPLFRRDDPSQMLLIKRKTYRFKGANARRYASAHGGRCPAPMGATPVHLPLHVSMGEPAIHHFSCHTGGSMAPFGASQSFVSLMTNTIHSMTKHDETAATMPITFRHSLDILMDVDHPLTTTDAAAFDESHNSFQPIPFDQSRRYDWKLLDEDFALLTSMMNPMLAV